MEKLTNERWINLFKMDDGFMLASRNETPDPSKIGVVAAMIDWNGKLIMVKQYRNIIGKHEIDLPAGLVDEGETPLEAAIREVKEETGLDCFHDTKNDFPQVFYSSAGLTDENYQLFLLKAKPGQAPNPEKGIEVIAVDESTDFLQYQMNYPITCRAMYALVCYLYSKRISTG